MMKALFAAIAALTMRLLHCLAAGTNPMIGEWRTGVVLSQFGRSVTTYTFDPHRTFRVATTFSRVGLPAMAVTGTDSFVTNKILRVASGRTNTATLSFEG
jgi:hypothetical protein